ncbi:MAG: histidine-binding protein [Dysgonamonadaceae bacterium]|jgi:hypothetical protein|nr:histidine-binding protein [Dysgonamonadaceae bacterium]
MKKLVLFAAICATVALTACNKKQAAPATDDAVTEEKTEVVADSTLTTPADSTAVDSTAVQ